MRFPFTNPGRLIVLCALVGVLSLPGLAEEKPISLSPNELQMGTMLTEQQVRGLRKEATRTSRQVFYQGRLEQWIFAQPQPLRVDVLFRTGKEPQVAAVHRR